MLPCPYSCSSGSVLMGELMLTAGAFMLHGVLAYIVSGVLVGKKDNKTGIKECSGASTAVHFLR